MSDKLPKILAVYLPQFHETNDNNKWWGKGFTDWNTVKHAEKCFDGHYAPWAPLNNNYYDLSNPETLMWQADLAKQYCIDGFCFYHYYFKDGKMELEKPAEILLENPDIDMPFCFNWANESWIRSWSNISGNIWSEKFESDKCDGEPAILAEQDYGSDNEWKKHFEYMLPFFFDRRYINIDDKPLFIIYRPESIPCINSMINLWRNMAKKAGLAGIYVVGANCNAAIFGLDASIVYEPRTSINRMIASERTVINEGVRCLDYQKVWDEMLYGKDYSGAKMYFMGVMGYDDTPRRGKNGTCLTNNTPEIFERNLEKLLVKCTQRKKEFVLINAWNEWGEGMYLEPDKKNGFRYLEAVKKAKSKTVMSDEIWRKVDNDYIEDNVNHEMRLLQQDIYKYKTFIDYYDKWLYLERTKSFNIEEYLKKLDINSVAIYGIGMLGKQLYMQLKGTSIKIEYGIDQYVGKFGDDIVVYRPDIDSFNNVDAIVITAYDEKNIENKLKSKTDAKIIRLSCMIDWLWRNGN